MPENLSSFLSILAIIAGPVVGFFLGRYYFQAKAMKEDQERGLEAQNIVEKARTEAKEIVLAAKDQSLALRKEAENEIKTMRQALQGDERRNDKRRMALEERTEKV